MESHSEEKAKESNASDAKDVNGIDAESKQPSQPADESQADVKPPAEVAAPAKDTPATEESAEKGDDASGKRTREEDDDEDASKRSKADDSQPPAANEAQVGSRWEEELLTDVVYRPMSDHLPIRLQVLNFTVVSCFTPLCSCLLCSELCAGRCTANPRRHGDSCCAASSSLSPSWPSPSSVSSTCWSSSIRSSF